MYAGLTGSMVTSAWLRFGLFIGNRRYPTIQEDYRHPQRIFRFYEAWFDWLLPRPGRHFLVTAADGWKLHPASEWRARLAADGVPAS
jgi:hypothetical protein